MTQLSCRSCLHSIGTCHGPALICTRTMQPVPSVVCDEFTFEPGTDEHENTTTDTGTGD